MRHGSRSTYIHARCRCEECSYANRKYMHAYYLANKEIALQKQADQRATEPEKFKARKAAYYQRNKKTELSKARKRNKLSKAAYDAKRYRSEAKLRRAQARTYSKTAAGRAAKFRQNSKRRAARRNVKSEPVDRAIVLLMYKGLCGICGEPIDEANFHVDHIIPLSRGGAHAYINCQPAHPSCNMQKH